MGEEQTEAVINMLLPRVQQTINAVVDGKLKEELPLLRVAMQNELWDKAVAEIGKRLNLPVDTIEKLQQIDDLVKGNKDSIEAFVTDMVTTVEGLKVRLKDVDLNKTVTMSYGELQKEKVKSGISWGAICFALGFAAGALALLLGTVL